MGSRENRLEEFSEKLSELAALDFSKRLDVTGNDDLFDAIANGINMMSEELDGMFISKTQLEERERALKRAQEVANIGHWDLDLVKNSLHWSDQVYRIFGLKPQELEATYEGFLATIHPDDRDMVNDAYTNSLKTQEPYSITHRIVLSDGTLKYVAENCETEFNGKGKPLFSTGTVQDITEQKRLEEYRSATSQIAEKANSSIDLQDFLSFLDERITSVIDNDEFYVTRYNDTIDELEFVYYRGQDWAPDELNPRRDGNSLSEYVVKNKQILVLNDEEVLDFARKHKLKLYGTTPKHWIGVPLFANKQLIGSISLQSLFTSTSFGGVDQHFLDFISNIVGQFIERKQAEQLLINKQAELEHIVHSIDEMVYRFSINPENPYQSPLSFISEQVEVIQGYTAAEIIADPEIWFASIHEKDLPHVTEVTGKAFAGEAGIRTYRVKHKTEDRIIWLEDRVNPVLDEKGNVKEIVGAARDITEQKKAELLKEALHNITNITLDTALSLTKTGEVVHHEVKKVLRASNLYIALYDELEDIVSFPYVSDEYLKSSTKQKAFSPRAFANGITEHILFSKKGVVINGSLDSFVSQHSIDKFFGKKPKSWMGVPLLLGKKAIGIIAIQSYNSPNAYSSRDLKVLEAVGIQVTVIVEHIQAQRAAKESYDELQAVSHITREALKAKSFDKVASIVLDTYKAQYNIKGGRVYQIDENKNKLEVSAQLMESEVIQKVQKKAKIKLTSVIPEIGVNSIFDKVIDHGEIFFASGTAEIKMVIQGHTNNRAFRKLAGWAVKVVGVKTFVIIPLISEDRVYGLMNLALGYVLSTKEKEKIQRFSQQISVSIGKILAEQALENSEEKYKTLFRSNPQPMWIYDVGTLKILEVNDAAISHYGYTEEEFLGLTINALMPKSEIKRLLPIIEKNSRGIERHSNFTHKKKDGSFINVDMASHDIKYEECQARMVLVNDITEQLKAQQEIKSSEDKFRSIFENSTDEIYLVDPKSFKILDLNRQAYLNLGYSKEEAKELRLPDITPTKDFLKKNLFRIKDILLKGEANFESSHTRKDGSQYPIDLKVKKIEYQGKSMMLAAVRDMTERKKSEEQLRKLANIVSNSNDSIIGTDLEGNVESWNQGAETIFGYPEKEMIGQSVFKLVPADFKKQAKEIVQKARSGTSLNIESQRIHASGKLIDVSMSVFATYNSEGTMTGLSSISRDITELKNVQADYLQLSQDLEKLVEERTEQLKQVHKHLSTVIDNANLILFATDKHGIFTLSEGNGLKALGLQPGEVVGHSIFDLYKDNPDVVKNMKKVFKGEEVTIQLSIDQIHYEATYLPTYENNKVVGMIGLAIDITQLVEGEIKYRQLVESASEGLFTSDIMGNFLLVNDVGAKITGYSTKELYSMNFKDLVRPDHSDMVNEFYGKQFKNRQEITHLNFPIVMKDGKEKWITQSLRLEYENGKDRIRAFQATVRDITTEMLAKQKADEANRMLKELELAIDNSSIVARTDLQGTIIYANYRFCQISGYTEDELIGRNQNIVNSGYHTKAFWKEMWSTIEKGQYWRGEVCNKNKSGDVYWVDTVVAPLVDEKGMPREYLSIRRDVTEKKKIEETLQESEERFREIFEGTSDLIQSLDGEGDIGYVNKAWKEKLEYTDKEIQTLSIWDVIHPDHHDTCIPKFKEVIENPGRLVNIDTDFISKNGHIISVAGNSVSSIKNGKKVTRSIFHDVSEMKNALNREKELGELRSKFVSTASHQFRTPLTVIQSNIELLDMVIDSTNIETQQRYAKISDRVHQEIKRMTSLMNDVLVLGKLNSNAISYHPEQVDLVELCKELAEQHNHIQDDGRIIEFLTKESSVTIKADLKLLSHAFTNLISNAFKYSKGTGNPELVLTQTTGEVEILVKDNGIGIPKEDLSGMFKPFFRSGNVKDIEGTGLGLSIVKEYVEMNGAEVKVESKLNKGTTFRVLFFK